MPKDINATDQLFQWRRPKNIFSNKNFDTSQSKCPLKVNPAVVVISISSWLILLIMQRSAPPLSFPWDEVGTSVVCRPLNLQGRSCVTAALHCVVHNHCCPQPLCCPQLTTGNFTAFSDAFMPPTKNCSSHEVDAGYESEQPRFTTISIGIAVSRDPRTDINVRS